MGRWLGPKGRKVEDQRFGTVQFYVTWSPITGAFSSQYHVVPGDSWSVEDLLVRLPAEAISVAVPSPVWPVSDNERTRLIKHFTPLLSGRTLRINLTFPLQGDEQPGIFEAVKEHGRRLWKTVAIPDQPVQLDGTFGEVIL